MTKNDTVSIVERIWATWGIDLPQAIRKQTYEAWHRIIHDLEAVDCNRALDEIVIEDRPWPPRPGTLRRRVIDGNNPNPAPSAIEAWSQLRQRADAMNHGEDGVPLHPLVAAVAKSLGASQSHSLYTNGDRDLFMRRYEEERALARWEDDKYRSVD
jgi:hypothetical protein